MIGWLMLSARWTPTSWRYRRSIETSRACIADVSFCEEPFAVPEDYSHIERACRAVCAAKALRDTILISFAPKRPIEMGDRLTDPAYADWVADPL